MQENDTIRLLRECDAGVQMGIESIDEVLDCVSAPAFKDSLTDKKREHEKLRSEIRTLLAENDGESKAPNRMAVGMSWIKTNAKLAWDGSDHTVADLMTDGCNMGVKSLHRYLNQYRAASPEAKNVANRLASLEENMAMDIRSYL